MYCLVIISSAASEMLNIYLNMYRISLFIARVFFIVHQTKGFNIDDLLTGSSDSHLISIYIQSYMQCKNVFCYIAFGIWHQSKAVFRWIQVFQG